MANLALLVASTAPTLWFWLFCSTFSYSHYKKLREGVLSSTYRNSMLLPGSWEAFPKRQDLKEIPLKDQQPARLKRTMFLQKASLHYLDLLRNSPDASQKEQTHFSKLAKDIHQTWSSMMSVSQHQMKNMQNSPSIVLKGVLCVFPQKHQGLVLILQTTSENPSFIFCIFTPNH